MKFVAVYVGDGLYQWAVVCNETVGYFSTVENLLRKLQKVLLK